MEENLKFLELLENPLFNPKGTPEQIQSYKNMLLKKEAKHPSQSYAMVGINPPPGTFSLKDLYDFCVEHYPYKDYIMCVEQHTGSGVIRPHLHILHPISPDARKNHVITRLAKVFKLERQSIDVSISRSSIVISRQEKYIRGEKKEEKLENVEKDIKDREYYNIPNIYNASVAWSNTT